MEGLLNHEQFETLKRNKILVFNQDESEKKAKEIIEALSVYKTKELDSFISGFIRVFKIEHSATSLLIVQVDKLQITVKSF